MATTRSGLKGYLHGHFKLAFALLGCSSEPPLTESRDASLETGPDSEVAFDAASCVAAAGVMRSVETDEDTVLSLDVLSESERSGGITVVATTMGEHGVVGLGIDGSVLYVPAQDFNGTDRFGYTLRDCHGVEAVSLVTVSVRPVNDPPVGRVTSGSTREDLPLVLDVLGGATDADGDQIGVSFQPQFGLFGQSNAGSMRRSDVVEASQDKYTTAIYGGTALTEKPEEDDWNPASEGEYFDEMIMLLRGGPPEIGSIWVQGERDGNARVGRASYEASLDAFIEGYNAATGGAPLAVVLLSRQSTAYTSRSDGWDAVRAAQQASADKFDNVIWLDPDPLVPEFRDQIHYTFSFAGKLLTHVQEQLELASRQPQRYGSLSFGDDGMLVYTPTAGFQGTDRFNYTLADGNGGETVVTVTVTVN